MTFAAPTREIVLVLGGGGVRGFAHVGVLRACRHLGLQVRGIAGASIGALVGAFAAAGVSDDAMAALAGRLRKRDVFDVDYRGLLVRQHRVRGMYRGRGLTRFLDRHLPARTFAELQWPYACNAVNLYTGVTEVFGTGGDTTPPLHDVVRASCALPGFFPPVRLGAHEYADGGVTDPLPLALARPLRTPRVQAVGGVPVTLRGGRGGPVVVAVRCDTLDPTDAVPPLGTMFEVLGRSEAIRTQGVVDQTLAAGADLPVIVVSPLVHDRGLFDVRDVDAVIAAGETAALAALTDHPWLHTGPIAPPQPQPHLRRRPSDTRPIVLPG